MSELKAFQVVAIKSDEQVVPKVDHQALSLYGDSCDELIFENHLNGLIEKAVEGYNASVAFFSQKKRYLLEEEGLIVKCLQRLFGLLQSNVSVTVEHYHIYNDEIDDSLLGSSNNKHIRIKELKPGELILESITKKSISNLSEILDSLKIARKNVIVQNTNMSRCSTVTIYGCRLVLEQATHKSVLDFFDIPFQPLDTKENFKLHGYKQTFLHVVKAINENQSGKSVLIPYRESKITRLMSQCLGGNSYTVALFDNIPETHIAIFTGINNKPVLQ